MAEQSNENGLWLKVDTPTASGNLPLDTTQVNSLLKEDAQQTNGHANVGVPKTTHQPKVSIVRSLYSQKDFDEDYQAGSRPALSLKDSVKKKISKCQFSGSCFKDLLYTVFPFIHILKNYNIRTDLSGDIVSGLTIGIMHIPQGMAYGMLTTLPPVYGLYMSFFPVLIYFFFGSSKHISIGTFAVACLMIGSAVTKGYNSVAGTLHVAESIPAGNQSNLTDSVGDEESVMSAEEIDIRLQFAMSVSFIAGSVQLLMGFFRLGFMTVYLSDSLVSGFTTGAACHVFTSQIKHIFGIKTARYSGALKLVYTYMDFFTNIPKTNIITLVISTLCIAILYSVGRFINRNPNLKPKMFMPVPIELIVVVLGTVISYLINLEEKYDVVVVDDIPTGLPVPNLHAFSRTTDVISDGIALAIVIFAISISMAKILAKKHDYEVNANQELISFGIATVFSSFFSTSAPSASLSRSLVQEQVGGKTQIAGLISCVLLLVVLLAIGPYFRTLPNVHYYSNLFWTLVSPRGSTSHVILFLQCVLAAIIIVALRGMFLQVLDLKKLWRISVIDFFVWIVAFLATVLLDVDLGLGVAVIFAIITVICRSQRPYSCLLGQMPGTDIYRDVNVYPEAKEIVGVKIFRFESSLFFANTEHFRTNIYKKTVNPRTLKLMQNKRETKLQKEREKMMRLKKVSFDNHEMEIVVQEDDEIKVMVAGGNILTGAHDTDFHTVIIDCSSWSYVDSMAVKVLSSVIGEYKIVNVKIYLASCKSGITEMFLKTQFYDTLDHSNIFMTIHDAIVHSQHIGLPIRSKEKKSINLSCDGDSTSAPMFYQPLKYADKEKDEVIVSHDNEDASTAAPYSPLKYAGEDNNTTIVSSENEAASTATLYRPLNNAGEDNDACIVSCNSDAASSAMPYSPLKYAGNAVKITENSNTGSSEG